VKIEDFCPRLGLDRWDRKDLAVIAEFEPSGPLLPIEFCRVSGNGRLTLVIAEAFGTRCITYSAISAFDDLDAAIENLRVRENMPSSRGVGFIVPRRRKASATAHQRHPQAVKAIAAWADGRGLDAAIWTALGSNFEEKTRKQFSVEAAIQYLESRDKKTLDAALDYIRRAPHEVQTPVREAVTIRWPEAGTVLVP